MRWSFKVDSMKSRLADVTREVMMTSMKHVPESRGYFDHARVNHAAILLHYKIPYN